jgi:hypothetical protein
MPSLTSNDLTISIGLFGKDVHVKIRSLDIHVTEQQLIDMIYPFFDEKEKLQANANPSVKPV